MQFDLTINNLVVVKAPNVRLGQRGWVVDRFARNRVLYVVQFDDNCIGYFERSELERSVTEKMDIDGDKSKDFHDMTELVTRP